MPGKADSYGFLKAYSIVSPLIIFGHMLVCYISNHTNHIACCRREGEVIEGDNNDSYVSIQGPS